MLIQRTSRRNLISIGLPGTIPAETELFRMRKKNQRKFVIEQRDFEVDLFEFRVFTDWSHQEQLW